MELGTIFRETFQGWTKIWWKTGLLGLVVGGLQVLTAVYLVLHHINEESLTALGYTTLLTLISLILDYVIIIFALKAVELGKENNTPYYILKFFSFWLISVIVGVMVLLGALLLVVPGIILGIIYAFAIYGNIEAGKSVGESLEYSKLITKGKKFRIFVIMLILFSVKFLFSIPISNIVDGVDFKNFTSIASFADMSGKAILVMIAYIFTYIIAAFSYVGSAVVYKKLKEEYEQKEKEDIEFSSEM